VEKPQKNWCLFESIPIKVWTISEEVPAFYRFQYKVKVLSLIMNSVSVIIWCLPCFIFRFYTEIAAIAAFHIDKYPHLKGSLFLFTKISLFDLVNVPKDPTENTKSQLDRMFMLAWGCRYRSGETHHPNFTVIGLAEQFLDKV
jgi:hypothetical protein